MRDGYHFEGTNDPVARERLAVRAESIECSTHHGVSGKALCSPSDLIRPVRPSFRRLQSCQLLSDLCFSASVTEPVFRHLPEPESEVPNSRGGQAASFALADSPDACLPPQR